MTILYRDDLNILGANVRVVATENSYFVVLSDIWDYAYKQGASQRPQLRSVLFHNGIREFEYSSYSYDGLFGHYPETFCARQAQIIPMDLVYSFLFLTGLPDDTAINFLGELHAMADERRAITAPLSEPDRKVEEETADLVRKLRKDNIAQKKAIDKLTSRLNDLEFQFVIVSGKLRNLEKENAGKDAASEVRKAASILYARSKQLEGQ
jgi:hypothetical protein